MFALELVYLRTIQCAHWHGTQQCHITLHVLHILFMYACLNTRNWSVQQSLHMSDANAVTEV
jgi:hypothetical protein